MDKVRNEYAKQGVKSYYETRGATYRNPHEHIIKKLLANAKKKNYVGKSVLDLSCGSGEATLALLALDPKYDITATDPYTRAAYKQRTGKTALALSFIHIAQGKLPRDKKYDTITASFALHLCPESLLPALLFQLREHTSNNATLLVLTPHKRPTIDERHGWTLKEEIVEEKVRMRVYQRY